MDALDAALVEFNGGAQPRLLAAQSTALPPPLRSALQALSTPGPNELDCAATLDATLARLAAEAVRDLLSQTRLPPEQIRAIGSHGQTIRHMPRGPEPYTLQICNPSLLAELTGIATVADFRRRDMAAGGQGAPLAPAFHAAFFTHPAENRVAVNIGGMANITVLPAGMKAPVSGFDTGPGNVLLDAWTQRHLGEPVDQDGRWGAGGRVIDTLLAVCLSDDYFALPPPKSTGREYFNSAWLERKLVEWGGTAVPQDVQATLAALTAQSIAQAIRHHAENAQRLLVCGGGVHNQALLAGLQQHLPGVPVESTAQHGVDPDYLEAIGFAWLAKRTLEGLPGNLPTVTGASGWRVLGGIYPA